MQKHSPDCKCVNCEDARTIDGLRKELNRYRELERACQSWIDWRNRLSFDCTIMQVGNDTEKWGRALNRICEPLRGFLGNWFKNNATK